MRELSDRTANFTDSVIRRMTRIANRYGAVLEKHLLKNMNISQELI